MFRHKWVFGSANNGIERNYDALETPVDIANRMFTKGCPMKCIKEVTELQENELLKIHAHYLASRI